jgi:hypothetical protein
MQYFAHCPLCEVTILVIALFAIWVAYRITTYTPKRRYGCNPHDAKYGRKQ